MPFSRFLLAMLTALAAAASASAPWARPDPKEGARAEIADPAAKARQQRYEACLARARNNPASAREEAARWAAAGGGALARHCAAIALIAQGATREAASLLTETGSAPEAALSAEERASMLRLAGGLWLRLGQNELAKRCFKTVLTLVESDRDALIGLARTAAEIGNFEAAEKRLTKLLEAQPDDPEALTLRAAARRVQGRPDPALEDASRATALRPASALAWFERGAAERALGRPNDARESWLRASALDFEGQAGEEARHAIQILDGG